MKHLIFNLLVVAALAASPAKQTFTGIVTDDNCPKADHSVMRMGPTDAECAMACLEAHAALYGLYDGNDFYTLSDQKTPEKFIGKKVRVTGTLDAKTKTVQVDSITVGKWAADLAVAVRRIGSKNCVTIDLGPRNSPD